MRPWLKLLIEAGPLVVFFGAYSATNLMTATAVFMVAIAVALAASIAIERRVPIMPLVSAAVVMVFGGLTLWLDDDTINKMKPTIINGLFAAALFGGLFFRRALLKPLFGTVMKLDETGWMKLSLRWAFFFLLVAVLNEAVWRHFSTDNWVTFKVFGIMPLTVIFAMAQTPLIQRHSTDPDIRKSETPAE
jgi:intracellular septation protein